MLNLSHDIQTEYERCMKAFPRDPYASPTTIGIHDVIRAHFLIVDYFFTERDGEGVGGVGPKDTDRLHSAVYRQFTEFDGHEKYKDPLEKCATLVFGLVKDHPFHDANKRTAFLVALYFLDRIRRTPAVPQKKFEDFLVALADDKLEKKPRFEKVTRKSDEPIITFIADTLRRYTRPIDKRHYRVTYRELNNILRASDYELCNPHGNFIDVCRIERPRRYIVAGPRKIKRVKLGQIGFPGWKSQVSRKDVNKARRLSRLTAERGHDSQSFFKGVDNLESLIDEYKGPLRRLSMR